MKQIVTSFATAAVVFIAGCQAVRPPYTLSVGALGVESQGETAVITIGSPQLYARESLINDRIGEVRLLQTLLREAEDKAFRDRFGSQIDRELTHSAAFVASLSAAIDPGVRASDHRAEDAAVRRAEIDALQDAIQREKLRRELTALQSSEPSPAESSTTPTDASAPSSAPPAATSSTTPAATTGTTGTTPATPPQSFAAMDEAKKRHDTLLAQPATPVSSASVSVDPQDQFRDVQAYRSMLRQALSAASLDDIHDHDGHALYRLQFQVTLFPGERNDLLGVVELEAMAPSEAVTPEYLERLYRRWLRHVASRLNQVLPKNRGLYTDPAYLRLGSAGLYSLVTVILENSKGERIRAFRLPIPARATKVADVHLILEEHCPAAKSSTSSAPTRPACTWRIPEPTIDPTIGKQLAAGLLAIDTARAEWSLRKDVENMVVALRKDDGNVEIDVPPKFAEALATSANATTPTDTSPPPPQLNWVGRPRAYAVSPPEQVQRISTNAQGASSVEAALAIATASLGDVAGLNASVGYLRSATGRIEALERSPLVVAFAADGTRDAERDAGSKTTFGWALGPELRIDPDGRNLVYRQRVRTHELLADVSAPSWWPSIRLKARTSWRTVWNAPSNACLTTQAKCDEIERVYEIPLPANTASMDALTNILSSATIGHIVSPTKINHVEPYYISACAKRVRLQISGANMWRGARVALAGIESDKVEVLPDMEGISAEFDLDDLFSTANSPMDQATLAQGLTLTVWTRNGADSEILRLIGSRRPAGNDTPATCSALVPVAPSADENNGEIVSVSPLAIDQCAKQVDLIVKLSHPHGRAALPNGGQVSAPSEAAGDAGPQFLLGTHAGRVLGQQSSHNSTSSSVHLRFTDGPFVTSVGTGSVALSAMIGDDISSMPLRVLACRAEPAASPPK